jgi:rhamnosyltransferase
MTGTQPTDLAAAPLLNRGTEPNRPPASVVIRNRNERGHLERLLRILGRQTMLPEVIVVDNESTDGSAEVAAANGANVVHLPKPDFTYGHAINVGVANASADIIVMLSSHSVPLGGQFIENCLKPFRDEKVAAAGCLRMDNFDDEILDAIEGMQIDIKQSWLDSKTLTGPVNWDIDLTLFPANNGCAFRKSVWQQIPFDEHLEASEDMLWCYRVLNAGYRIATASAFYKYSVVPRLWPALRKYKFEQTALYRLTGQRRPLRRVLRDLLIVTPRAAAATTLKLACISLITAAAPWYARRPPRRGSKW